MRSKLLLLIVISSFFSSLSAQEKESSFGINFSGFIKNDFYYDSRKTVSAREGHFLLWPAPIITDANGEDLNATPELNLLAIQSRLRGTVYGPDAFGAKTSGAIEADFFGQANDNINLFRLRHAYIKLNWENTEILTGQYWNPLFVTQCYPATLSFNTGVPIASFSRNPQFRVTRSFGNLSLLAAIVGQRDYTTRGPDPANNDVVLVSSEFLRNTIVPDMHLQLHYKSVNAETGTGFYGGGGIAWKRITPRTKSVVGDLSYKVDEKLDGLSAVAYTKLVLKPLTFKLKGRYGENIPDVLTISGFAVKELVDPVTGERTYTPLTNVSVWTDTHTNGKNFQAGVFAGWLKNTGTKEELSSPDNTVYGLGTNIETLIRVSPRLVYQMNKTKFGMELEYTSAAYGSSFDTFYRPATTNKVANTRILLSVIQSF